MVTETVFLSEVNEPYSNDRYLLTELIPIELFPWIAIASSICEISDSIVYTRSNISGVFTKRTNLHKQRKLVQQAILFVKIKCNQNIKIQTFQQFPW